MSSCSELRTKARATLGGGIFKPEWLIALAIYLVVGFVISASSSLFVGPLILTGPLYFGMTKYYSGRANRSIAHDDFGVVLDGFKVDFLGNLITALLQVIFIALWSMLFFIPGIVKTYSYAMTFYVKCDHPEYTATQAITESRKLMDGYKMKLFLLQLSFIGWMIVGSLCFGIGTLWVYTYMQAATAEFYQELKAIKYGAPTADAPSCEAIG